MSARLRATGSYERRGQPSRVRDRAAERRAIELSIAEQRATAERLLEQLHTAEPVPFSEFPLLDAEARDLLLRLVADGQAVGQDALGQRRTPDDPVSVVSLDGGLRVEVVPAPNAPAVRLEMRDGVLTGPAHRIRVRAVS